LIRRVVVLLLSLLFCLPTTPLACPSTEELLANAKRLYAEKRWNEIVRLIPASPDLPADLDYFRGMALARLERWEEAKRAFEMGKAKQPQDKRFPLELAGIAFKEKNLPEARQKLNRALRLDPQDRYTLDFLGTLYLLDHNLEAALDKWNLVEKPAIEEITLDPLPRVDPVLLDRAFDFSQGSVLQLREYRTTRRRIEFLQIFPRYQFELLARPDGKFNMLFRGEERNGWGDSKWQGLLSLFSGLPYLTVYPEFYNLKRSAMNFSSLLRWDDQKRRFYAALSAPPKRNPKWRYQFDLDGRNENWNLTSRAGLGTVGSFNLQKLDFGAGLLNVVNDRWSWSSGASLSDRWFRNLAGNGLHSNPAFQNGVVLKYRAAVDYELLSIPEKRFRLESTGSAQFGRFFAESPHSFSRLAGSLEAHWFAQARGDDYEMIGQFRAGKTFGTIPFDEHFILGLERDNDLPLRAHIGTRDGRKGSAPLGRDFILTNWQVDKNLYDSGFLKLKLGPFVDSGRAYDNSETFGSQTGLRDAGGQLKVQILGGVTFIFTYGKDLRTGRNAFYAMVAH
jgi:hypothetical protein